LEYFSKYYCTKLEAASESEISFIGNKKYENFGPTPKLV
jgi:hypothetical protein